jgi:endonuclease YncB( thermonuclease family)
VSRKLPRGWRATGASAGLRRHASPPSTARRPRRWSARLLPGLIALGALAGIGAFRDGRITVDFPIDRPIKLVPTGADASITGRASVVDGDTLEIHGARIRILDIDAPESRQTCTADDGIAWRCGQKAALVLDDWIGQRAVSCATDGKDRYGRWLARCAVGGQDLGQWMALSGWAVPYKNCKREVIQNAADQAKAAKVGIWAGTFQMPWDWRDAN